VNVTSGVIHTTHIPIVAMRPAYVLSKMTAAMLFQLIAMHTPPEKMQVVTFNPGSVYGSGWKAMGYSPERFDSGENSSHMLFLLILEHMLMILLC
jgi:nucleoside-diphosphate-sugar epimerase